MKKMNNKLLRGAKLIEGTDDSISNGIPTACGSSNEIKISLYIFLRNAVLRADPNGCFV